MIQQFGYWGGCLNDSAAFRVQTDYCLIEFGAVSEAGFVTDSVVAPFINFKVTKNIQDYAGTSFNGALNISGGSCLGLCKSLQDTGYKLITETKIFDVDFAKNKKSELFRYVLYRWSINPLTDNGLDSSFVYQEINLKNIQCTKNGFLIDFDDGSVVEKNNGKKPTGNIPRDACFELVNTQNPEEYWRFGRCNSEIWVRKNDQGG